MGMVIKNNMSANNSLNTLNRNSKALSKSLKKVSSGMKINSAADDASGYSISEAMRVNIRALEQANTNTQNGRSLLNVAEGALSNTVDILRTLKEKAINAANDTNTDADRAIIQKEMDQSIDQINDNSNVTFNGKYIFDGAVDKTHSVEQTIVAALYSEWLPNALDLVTASTGLSFEFGDPDVREMDVKFVNTGGSDLASISSTGIAGGKTKTLTLNVNMDFYKDLDETDVNGAIKGLTGGFLDRTIAHEMTHALMAANIEGWDKMPQFVAEGSAEVIHGIDDERKDSIQSLADSGSFAGKLDITDTGTGDADSYAAGYMFFRYLARQTGGNDAKGVLTRFMTSLSESSGSEDMEKRLDKAIAAATKGTFVDFASAKAKMSADRTAAASGTDFLLNSCGIDLANKDTGSITGYDAGSRYDKNDKDAVFEAGSVKFWTNPTAKTTIINGLEVKWPSVIQIKGGVYFQTGTESSQNLHIAFSKIDAQAMGLQDDNGRNMQVTTQMRAEAAIYQLDKSIQRALNQQTTIGSISSRMEYTSANLVTAHENVTSAESVIRDADMAKEMTEYTRNNVLMQAAQSMMSQANQKSSDVLNLLQ